MSVLKGRNGNSTEKTAFVSAVIVAAGSSNRMGGVNKQWLIIDGIPVIARSLMAFDDSPIISEIIISAREIDIPDLYALIKEFRVKKVKTIVKGGETRQESVFNAVRVCSAFSDYIAIHDGARPFITSDVIENTTIAAMQFGAASSAVRVKDTIKITDEYGFVESTPNRDKLWAVQTPQVFDAHIYRSAMQAIENSESYTDDCQLIESFGKRVKMVEGSYRNIKITTPDDVILATAIARSEED